ncbi:MAG: glycosyltransferase family 2 protein [Gemmataceae bacterium]|nr:glycosyltransferase family 2 protein [Gemmataceae bacterium]
MSHPRAPLIPGLPPARATCTASAQVAQGLVPIADDAEPLAPWPALRRKRRAARRLHPAPEPVEVSVCIANWNCRDLLRACLESVLDRPQGVVVETVVVDNGSTDGAADMVAAEFPETVLVRNPTNRGFARANNQAAELARGRYLFFLNNDTVVPPGALRRLVDYAAAHPDVGMVGPSLRDVRGRYQVSYRRRPTMATLLHRTSLLRWTGLFRGAYRAYRREDFDPHTVRAVDVLMGAAVLLPREQFFACGGWDEEFNFGGEDLDLSTRVNRTARVVYLPEVEITHYGRVSTRQHIGYASAQMITGFARYLRKCGCSPLRLTLYKLIVTLDAPVQMTGKGLQYLWRRLRGRRQDAGKSLLACRGLAHFVLRGLGPFWRA